MTYLITATQVTPQGTRPLLEEFEENGPAMKRAEELAVTKDTRDVKLWGFIGAPFVRQTVDWRKGAASDSE